MAVSRFDTLVAEQLLPAVLDEFGVAELYQAPGGGAPVAVTALIREPQGNEILVLGGGAEFDQQTTVIEFADTVAFTPVEGGRFGVGNWTITQKPVAAAGRWTCVCLKESGPALAPRRVGRPG